MTLFDAYLIIDWSSAAKDTGPRERPDAVWIGEVVGGGRPSAAYRRTRTLASDDVQRRLQEHAHLGRRVLVGFDFPYGYPRGFASSLGLSARVAPWRAVWQELARLISDGADNSNNRFALASGLNQRCGPGPGPFWGTPEQSKTAHLTTGRQDWFTYPYQTGFGVALPEWRIAELRAKEQGARPHPVWKLYTSGSVGGQALVGIPWLERLRETPALATYSSVWPFETGFTGSPVPPQGPWVLHAEVFPGAVEGAMELDDPIRDRAQVRGLAKWARDLDWEGRLGQLFDLPASLTDADREACEREEGWILGVR